ncbi:MAG: oxygenase MpaB family protein [Terracidiphilus sp.]
MRLHSPALFLPRSISLRALGIARFKTARRSGVSNKEMEPALNAKSDSMVRREDLESLLALVKQNRTHPLAGVFGANSISWKINRESALFLGAGRAALLQLAHPWVAIALAQHSSLLSNPITRFHNTFRVVFTMIFGSVPQALGASRSLHQLHTRIRGELPSPVAGYAQGSSYAANYIPALCWVYATLVESAVLAYECVMPPLKAPELAAYYAESRTLASLFGIPATALPQDWESFVAYIAEMCASDSLGADARSRLMAQSLLKGAGSWIHPPRWYRGLTAYWMPERFRQEFHLEFAAADQRAAQRARVWLPKVYRRLPPAVRFVGPFHEARARLDHRKPGPIARRSNRFWIGESLLPFGD